MIYLSGKISGANWGFIGQRFNELYGWWWARKLTRQGHYVFCPHTNGFLTGGNYEGYMKFDFEMLDKCEEIWMMPNWGKSPGAVREREYAKKNKKIIKYL